MAQEDITYHYCFDFSSGVRKRFLLQIDGTSFSLKDTSISKPEWALLPNHQCSCCRLDRQRAGYCPVAVNIADLVSSFKDVLSHESCTVSCITSERTVSKNTIVQDGLSSILGIIMATSGCPTMEVLKPMARFHLPFATVDESTFRSVSTYLLRQFFLDRENGNGDFRLERIKEHWKQIEKVNEGILRRIKSASELDADRNAIVILNCLAQILTMEVDEDLNSLRPIFFPEQDQPI